MSEVPSLAFRRLAHLLGGAGRAFDHLAQRLEVLPETEGLGQGPQLVERPGEEGAHGHGLGGEGILDDGVQAFAGRQFLVAAGPGDVLGVVAEAAREVGIRVEAEQQQVLEGEVRHIQGQLVAGIVRAHFHAGHGQVDAGEEVLPLDLRGHVLHVPGFAGGEEAPGVDVVQLVAGDLDEALHGLGLGAGAHGDPVVVAEADAAPHQIVGQAQVVGVAAVQIRHVQGGRVREGEVPHRFVGREPDDGLAVLLRGLERRAGAGGDEERREGPHEPRAGDVDLVLVGVQVAVATLRVGQVHEVPGQHGLGQAQVGVGAGRGQLGAVDLDAALQVAPLGQMPGHGHAVGPDLRQHEQVAVPVVQGFAEGAAGLVEGVDEGGLQQAAFVHRALGRVVGPRDPLDHPVEDLQLVVLLRPGRQHLGPQVVHEGHAIRPGAHGEQRAELRIHQVPLQLQPAEAARGSGLQRRLAGQLELLDEGVQVEH